jgi:hypothetical protein
MDARETWLYLNRMARHRPLDKYENLQLEDARFNERLRRHDALYGGGRIKRAVAKLLDEISRELRIEWMVVKLNNFLLRIWPKP